MLKSLPGFLLDLVFPAFCQGCAKEGIYLCLSCQNSIESPIHRCLKCGKNSQLGQVHDECADSKTALRGLMVAAEYAEPAIRNLIWQLKYNSVRDISKTMALVMADFIVKNDLADYFAESVVTAVPMYRNRVRFRGFNQAEEIAKHLSANLGLEYCDLLTKSKSTTRQVDLERKDRLENLRGAFELHPSLNPSPSSLPQKRVRFSGTPARGGKIPEYNKLSNKKVILIDDVATTGTTLNECALILKQLGPAEIWGLVVARN